MNNHRSNNFRPVSIPASPWALVGGSGIEKSTTTLPVSLDALAAPTYGKTQDRLQAYTNKSRSSLSLECRHSAERGNWSPETTIKRINPRSRSTEGCCAV